ncbi:MAG TPA: lysophospholipid acyltransferase family protein [Actinomycetota bacterium]|nr:lysophospholipid acyltransferase family protein [Actinomycetota bacterium]
MIDGEALSWSPRRREPAYVVAKSVLRPWANLWFRKHIEGMEHVPRVGPAIMAFNHIAYLDALAALYLPDSIGRRARFLAKAELFADWRLGWLLRGSGMIPVARGTSSARSSLEAAFSALDHGELIAIFPEGSAADSEDLSVRPLKSGTARLALGSGAPVIPCGLWGTQNVWPKNRKKNWRPGQHLAASIGPPLTFTGDPDSPEDWMQVGEELRRTLQALVDPLQERIPDRRR